MLKPDMFVAMTEAQHSRWMTSWIDTRKVEQMALGSCDLKLKWDSQETSVVTDERCLNKYKSLEFTFSCTFEYWYQYSNMGLL